MNIHIYTYDPSPSSYYNEGRKEYEKRLSRYCKIKHTLYKTPRQLEKGKSSLLSSFSTSQNHMVYFIQTGLSDSLTDSLDFASLIDKQGLTGISSLTYLVGFPAEDSFLSSFHPDFLSLSRMNIGPSLLSLILEEQIYRAYRILNHEPYHK